MTSTPLPDGSPAEEARKSFHESLDELRTDVIRLAALTTEAIAAGTQALLDGDLNAAEDAIEADDEIDELTHTIEDRTFLLLARQQPLATDLRFLVTVMRVAHELERSADLMVNVAKTTRRLYPHQLDPKIRGIIARMGTQASNQTASPSTRSPTPTHRGRPRSPTWTTRWTSSPRACSATCSQVTAATKAPCSSRSRWRWSAGTTSGSPTTRSRSPSASGSW